MLQKACSARAPAFSRRAVVCLASAGSTKAASAMVTLHYFPLRGRAEVVKLICSAKDIPLENVDVDFQNMKTDRTAYPFGQCPRMVDGDVDISQSNAMIRHLARKHQLYGAIEKEMAQVDMLIDGVESIRGKYLILIYQDQLKPEAKEAYAQTHISKDSANGRNGGAHFDYLESLLASNGGGSGFFVGSGLTAADLCVWEIVDLHMRLFKEQMEATYPLLTGHFKRVAELPGIKQYLASPQRLEKYPLLTGHYSRIAELAGIKEYLASPRRLEKVNNNNLG